MTEEQKTEAIPEAIPGAEEKRKDNLVLARTIFLRSLGLVYFIAFISYYFQALGLNGWEGISSSNRYLELISSQSGLEKYWLYPTIFWLNSSDLALQAVPLICACLSLLVVAGIASGFLLPILWFCYLSIITVGGDFMSFQWDILLLETGFLSLFFADFHAFDCFWVRGRASRNLGADAARRRFSLDPLAPPVVMSWLFRLLIFKLMFSSGCCKLLSGDPNWWNLTALEYHYWTQPLPTPPAWLAAQMPAWFLKLSCVGVFLSELGLPFLVWGDRRFRLVFAISTVALQIIIMVTGNYTFFNILTIFLCIPILDDRYLTYLGPAGAKSESARADLNRVPLGKFRTALTVLMVSILLLLNGIHSFGRSLVPSAAREYISLLYPWNLVNSYGLFAVMTTTRKEIIVEGSDDGQKWIPYSFKFKPGDLHRAPPIVAPYQPRLDWQMWFAALGPLEDSPWFSQFIFRLLNGSPEVENLLESKPFADHAPTYIRARLEDYRFTDFSQMQKTGAWWKSSDDGMFFPPARLKRKVENHFKLDSLPDPNAILRP